jgi:hypothetical protein
MSRNSPTPTRTIMVSLRKDPGHIPASHLTTAHLLTVFPNNVAEPERYDIMNLLKKFQRISVHVQCVEQLNFFIAQLPC